MLSTLHFSLTVPTPYNFLTRYLRAAGSAEDGCGWACSCSARLAAQLLAALVAGCCVCKVLCGQKPWRRLFIPSPPPVCTAGR